MRRISLLFTATDRLAQDRRKTEQEWKSRISTLHLHVPRWFRVLGIRPSGRCFRELLGSPLECKTADGECKGRVLGGLQWRADWTVVTMKTYTDSMRLPTEAAINALPSLDSTKSGPQIGPHKMVAGCREVSRDGTGGGAADSPEVPAGKG